ncbi:MAG: endonuclease/exonuclease/phosphatase family protein [Actinomycetota bacterium]
MASTLRVVQLNVGSLLEPDWVNRRVEIAAWLRELRPDVCCFQEVWADANNPPSVEWIVDETDELGWHWVFAGDALAPAMWPDPSLRFGSAVLSRWPIDEHTFHRLPVVSDGDRFASSVPWELFHVRTAGLDVFSTHLAAAPTQGLHRRLQVVEIDQLIKEARGDRDDLRFGTKREHMPHVLCGDFNAEPESDEIRFLASLAPIDGQTTFHQDAWRMAGDGPGHTQDWRTSPIAAEMNINRKRIDYVFVGDAFQRAGSAGRILSAQLAFHESRTGVIASDHHGLVVDITWPQRPS